MGYVFTPENLNLFLTGLGQDMLLFAPKRYPGQGAFSDTDDIRYGKITCVEEIEFKEKSRHTFKEALLPINETLFYFTENSVREANPVHQGAVIFLRSCDLHAVKRLDTMYLKNGPEDYYYKRLRDNIKFILLPCEKPYENCFCVDAGTNRADNYDASLEFHQGHYRMDCKNSGWADLCRNYASAQKEVTPAFVTQTAVKAPFPETLADDIACDSIWSEYDGRCIACGRCNFSCPTCTCFTMQDIFYSDNGKVGERKRVWASCMVDGFTDVAGGGAYRKKPGERMRFKSLHKIQDFKQRFGYHMCVGCGRCDDVCPEYISFSHIIHKVQEAANDANNQ